MSRLSSEEEALILEAIAFFLEVCDDVTLADHQLSEQIKEKLGGSDG